MGGQRSQPALDRPEVEGVELPLDLDGPAFRPDVRPIGHQVRVLRDEVRRGRESIAAVAAERRR